MGKLQVEHKGMSEKQLGEKEKEKGVRKAITQSGGSIGGQRFAQPRAVWGRGEEKIQPSGKPAKADRRLHRMSRCYEKEKAVSRN